MPRAEADDVTKKVGRAGKGEPRQFGEDLRLDGFHVWRRLALPDQFHAGCGALLLRTPIS